jgi:hypothetical protein
MRDTREEFKEIYEWLDSLIVEVNRLNEVIDELIAEAPIKIGD